MRPAAWTDGSSRGRIQKYSVTDVVSWLDAELAVSVTVMDARGLMDGAVGEFIIFATARSTSHMKRVSGTVMQELSARGVLMFGSAPTIEGLNSDDGWMIIDGGQVLVFSNVEASAGFREQGHGDFVEAVVAFDVEAVGDFYDCGQPHLSLIHI